MRTSIATVSVSGTLTEKLAAIAAAGFDGVEIFENDLLACPLPPQDVRRRAADLGLSIDLYQPMRDFEAMPAPDLRRAEHKFRLMERLGADTLLVCSNVSPAAIDDDELAAAQLRLLAERAAGHGIRIAYEALAWGRHVHDYLHAWRIVRLADHPNLGTCLDSFHILSRGDDPIGIEAIPGDKIFFLQLADAPRLAMDVLRWSRHYRCFPGQGGFDLAGLVRHALNAGYAGPLSLEVFNDHFRQADAGRTARDGMRSLIGLDQALRGAEHPAVPTGLAFAELAGGAPVGGMLAALGFARSGSHPTKPVELWEQGAARLLLNATGTGPEMIAIGLDSPDPARAVEHAESLLAPVLPRERAPGEAPLDAVAAPDGTEIFFCGTAWRGDFGPAATVPGEITHIDHVALTQPWHHFDEAALFYRSVLGLRPQESVELPDPYGLLRSRAMATAPARDEHGAVRMVLNVAQVGSADPPWQHVALACDDVLAIARRLRADHPELLLPIPGNYYDDLEARHDVDPALRELGVLYDRDGHGEFLHLYTVTLGRVFFEVVQRIGGYRGYGAVNTPVRLAVQHAGSQ
ncbi:4-hydroxyphenylpyruvate dioxygenase [Microtetraspora sp. NBRC 13810]|uniref:bifunctional sugar phosphate isomerase/epimerase/4-hydroxyphenylpyruvate dioxygenase family protein n=1 Tax=Microtetraspora sp. NBRC 13810 TaxID=3030990 RepID=UPI0024A4C606|nr:sugar phosphate isomerase/epimerase and 4-hydroxyphenylpyruvate domain-containing protein [Microtetraspora sp. NBRC 13810]GLW09438.1 4-hydroxyphenylpyruvate dioxygenase [Microtetraspora sp. NBRC 13810]